MTRHQVLEEEVGVAEDVKVVGISRELIRSVFMTPRAQKLDVYAV